MPLFQQNTCQRTSRSFDCNDNFQPERVINPMARAYQDTIKALDLSDSTPPFDHSHY
jgi:hypothetical protein